MFTIELEYPTSSLNEPRYTGSYTCEHIDKVLEAGIDQYRVLLSSFQKYFPSLAKINPSSDGDPASPHYINGFLPGLDCVALYCMLAELKPRLYFEIGSGNSTKFARRSIADNKLDTRIISVDPYPRAEIDELCDLVLRVPLEEIDISVFNYLESGDIVFIDNSHRAFMNSDVTVCFLDIMPRLKSGVYLQLHDIFWPRDYPPEWNQRYYNEQYMLGALLANGLSNYEIVLPNFYNFLNDDLKKIIDPLWDSKEIFKDVERHGCSFWMRKK